MRSVSQGFNDWRCSIESPALPAQSIPEGPLRGRKQQGTHILLPLSSTRL
jgi:hypothetical protein